MSETAQQLADQIARDPHERAWLRLQVAEQHFSTWERSQLHGNRVKHVEKTDPEETERGLRIRIALLEHENEKLRMQLKVAKNIALIRAPRAHSATIRRSRPGSTRKAAVA